MSNMNEGRTSGDLEDLIARHLDGGLDADEQRRLARRLAESPAARQTLARYLRLEAAAFRLAAARQLAVPGGDHGGVRPAVEGRGAPDRGRRMRLGIAAIAGGLLAALLAAPVVGRWLPVQPTEIELVADQWLRVNESQRQEPAAELASDLGDESSGGVWANAEPDDDECRRDPPPSWLVAAMADAAADPTTTPDEG